MVDSLSRDRNAADSSLTGVTVVPLSKNINPSLVLVQPRKSRPIITERLLMGRNEPNQTNKQTNEPVNKSLLQTYLSPDVAQPSLLVRASVLAWM